MDDEGSASPSVSEWGAHMMIKARLCDLVDLFSHPIFARQHSSTAVG
ncbi:hypothetical protein [Methylibium sp.]|nr:hypothetical protein [Methylibium sp.]